MDVVDAAACDRWVPGPEIPKARTDLFAFALNEPERGLQGEHIAQLVPAYGLAFRLPGGSPAGCAAFHSLRHSRAAWLLVGGANLDSREAGRARLQRACGGADQGKTLGFNESS